MMQLKQLLLTANIARNICRNFVSTVDVNVKSINSIKIKSKDFLETSDDKVKVILLNGQQEEVDVKEVKSFNVHSTAKVFKVETSEPSKLSMILELPLESSPDVEIRVSTKGTNIHVENLQTKNIKIETENGSVWLKNIKSDAIKAKTTDGNISTKSLLLAKEIKLKSRSGVRKSSKCHLNDSENFLSRKSRSRSRRAIIWKSKEPQLMSTAATAPTISSHQRDKQFWRISTRTQPSSQAGRASSCQAFQAQFTRSCTTTKWRFNCLNFTVRITFRPRTQQRALTWDCPTESSASPISKWTQIAKLKIQFLSWSSATSRKMLFKLRRKAPRMEAAFMSNPTESLLSLAQCRGSTRLSWGKAWWKSD